MQIKKNEMKLVIDSTHDFAIDELKEYKQQIFSQIKNSIQIEKLDSKWNVDKKTFLIKLKGGGEDDYKKLWEKIKKYWHRN